MRERWLPVLAAFVCCAAVACEEATSDLDASTPNWDGGVEATQPEPPQIANWSKSCPAGWRGVEPEDAYGAGWCEPWPETGREKCAEDEAHFPGTEGCRRIGTECPTGDWSEELPSSGVLYVKAGASPEGDGTKVSPFGTIMDAMRHAEKGTIVALSKGTFEETVDLAEGVEVRGACVAETIVKGTVELPMAFLVRNPDTSLRNLKITGPGAGIGVVKSKNEPFPVGELHIEDVVIAEPVSWGIGITSGASLTGKTVVVRDVRQGDEASAFGLLMADASSVEITELAIMDFVGFAMEATGADTHIELVDLIVSDGMTKLDVPFSGIGLTAHSGVAVKLTNAVFENNGHIAVMTYDEGSSIVMMDTIVRGTRIDASLPTPLGGMSVTSGARLEAHRVLFAGNESMGLIVIGERARVESTDLVVIDTTSQEELHTWGRGLLVENGAQVSVERGVFLRNHESGVTALGEGAIVDLADLLVRDTRDPVYHSLAGGIVTANGAMLTVERGRIEANQNGVLALGGNAAVSLRNTVVSDSSDRMCEGPDCESRAAGSGIWAANEANVTVELFEISGNELCGVHLVSMSLVDGEGNLVPGGPGGTMDLHDGRVHHNGVCGANVQTGGFDTSRLTDGVTYYENNGRNLDSTQIAVPEIDLSLTE